MVKVLPLATHLLMRFRQQLHCLATPTTAFPATRDAPLRGFQRAFGFAIPARMEDACAARQRSEGLNAKDDAGFLSSSGK
jgi:hypothetical protein